MYWRSKAQVNVALSLSEAEFYALVEATREICFVVNILNILDEKVKQPISIYIDNFGAIFMAQNSTAKARTKHIDIKNHL